MPEVSEAGQKEGGRGTKKKGEQPRQERTEVVPERGAGGGKPGDAQLLVAAKVGDCVLVFCLRKRAWLIGWVRLIVSV